MNINEKKAENTPAGGVLIGKKDGQTIIHDEGTMSGYLVGKLHKDGGIKAVNKATGQPLEMQGGEVIITAPAVSDQTKREFEGKMMTNREILSAINEKGGGVSFADGGDIPAKLHTTDCEYKFGGKVVKDTDIAHSLGMNSTLKKGKQQFSSGDTTYDVDAIYNAIKKGKLRFKTKEVETFPMKYPVYDKKYSETVKTDFRKPNGITVRTESGEEVLIDGNHRMNNAYLKGRKTMKTYYIEDPKQISKFTKKNKFELGGENKMGGHLSKGKSLKQIAEMHNVSLADINDELAKGLEVEKEHFSDFKERTRVAKDHLVENPNYYTILEKAGLKNGGHIQRQELVEKSKKGDAPARDLNNYNDVMDLQADEAVGGESGLAFAKGGLVTKSNLKNIEKEFLSFTDNSNYKGIYDEDEIDNGVALEWGKYGYSVSEDQQDEDYKMLRDATAKFNTKNIGKFYASAELGDKYNTVTVFDYDMLANDSELVSRLPEKYFAKLKVGRSNNKNVTERIKQETDKLKELEAVGVISKKLGVSQEKADNILFSLKYDKEYYEKNKNQSKPRFDVFSSRNFPSKKFENLEETLDYIQSDDFANSVYMSTGYGNPISEGTVHLYGWGALNIKYKQDDFPFRPDGSTDFYKDRTTTLKIHPYLAVNVSGKQDFMTSFKKGISDFVWCYNYYVLGANDKNKFEDIDNLSDLLKFVETGSYDDGGITPIDANLEGDSVDIVESDFAKGGVVYDPKNPKIEKLTITRTGASSGSNRASVIGRNASTVSELQQIVSDYIGTSPQQEYDYIVFKVNDNTRGNYYIELNKGKKNTVKNVNPETLNSLNFKRVIDAKTYLVRNYDWTDFFELGSQTPASTDNYVKKIQVTYDSKLKGLSNGSSSQINTLELYGFLRGLSNGNYENIKIQPIGKNNYGYGFSPLYIKTQIWVNILFSFPQEMALKEINRILYELYPQLNFDDFVKNSSTSNQNQYPEYYEYIGDSSYSFSKGKIYKIINPNNLEAEENFIDNDGTENGFSGENYKKFKPSTEEAFLAQGTTSAKSITKDDINGTKIWIGDDLKLLEQVKEKLESLGYNKDGVESGDINISVYIFENDFYIQALREKSDFFTDSTLKEIFPEDLGIQTPTASQINTSNKEVSKVTLVYDTGTLREITCNNGSKLFDAYKLIEEQAEGGSLEVKVTLNGKYNGGKFFETEGISQEVGQGGFEPSQVYSFEEFEKFVKNLFSAFNFDNFFSGSQAPTSNKEKVMFLTAQNGSTQRDVINVGELSDFISDFLADNSGVDFSDGTKLRINLYLNGDNSSAPYVISLGENVSCNTCLDVLTDGVQRIKEIILSYAGTDEFDWSDFFEEESKQTPTLSGASGSVQEIEDLKEAVGVLEGIASQVSKKYNTENYEESLKLLNEVKEEYELTLSFTPESSFMYERIELMKKTTEIQKEITRITELKNGGAFYILSKVIERLEKGENWKELGKGEIMVNEVPEQEIDTVIYTEKFKNWFGDWEKALVTKEYDYVSKALTESGKPCVMYHGAKRIKYSYRQVSNGVLYLAENKSYAEWFSENNSPYQKEGDYLTQCFVNLKNPIDLTPFGVEEVDLRDIIQYIDALYPLAKIYDVLEPPVLSLEIMNNNLIGLKVRAWNIIRQYPALNNHIRENTNYDGFIYYENNPSDKIFNEQTGQLEDRITKATAVFNSNQVKLVDAILFDDSLDDWRFEKGGKVNN